MRAKRSRCTCMYVPAGASGWVADIVIDDGVVAYLRMAVRGETSETGERGSQLPSRCSANLQAQPRRAAAGKSEGASKALPGVGRSGRNVKCEVTRRKAIILPSSHILFPVSPSAPARRVRRECARRSLNCLSLSVACTAPSPSASSPPPPSPSPTPPPPPHPFFPPVALHLVCTPPSHLVPQTTNLLARACKRATPRCPPSTPPRHDLRPLRTRLHLVLRPHPAHARYHNLERCAAKLLSPTCCTLICSRGLGTMIRLHSRLISP
jgi:hypothetical protein